MCRTAFPRPLLLKGPWASDSALSPEQPPQLLHPPLNFPLQLRKLSEDLLRWSMRYLGMDNLLVSVNAEVVSLRHEIILRYTEALRRPRALTLLAVPLLPAGENVRKVV